MANPIRGLIDIHGESDSGKSTLALTCGYPPEQIAFIDADIKGQNVVEQMRDAGHEFGFYENFVRGSQGMNEIALHEYGLRTIARIEGVQEQRRKSSSPPLMAVVWDTFTGFENTFFPYVATRPSQFRMTYAAMGKIKNAEMWIVSFDYEAQIVSRLLAIAPLVIITSHLKDQYLGDRKTGQQTPSVKRAVVKMASLRLWLRHNPGSQAPLGYVSKRPQKMVLSDEGFMVPIAVLPRKLNPCTWERIWYYWEHPIGDRQPELSETLTEDEVALLSGTITKAQMEVLKVMASMGAGGASDGGPAEEAAMEVVFQLPPDRAHAVFEEVTGAGGNIIQVAKQLSEEFSIGISVADVVKAKGKYQGNGSGTG